MFNALTWKDDENAVVILSFTKDEKRSCRDRVKVRPHLYIFDNSFIDEKESLVTQFSVELQLLIDAVSWTINKSDKPVNFGRFDEAVLFQLAMRHNLLPWLLPYAKTFEIGSKDFIKDIVSYLLKAGIKHQLQTLELVKLSSLLNQQGIEHTVLKGATIEKQFYKGFVDSRYSDDIDILISSHDLNRVNDLLLFANYRQRKPRNLTTLALFLKQHETWFRWRDIGFKKQSMGKECVDLHWRIADDFTIPVKTKELFKQLQTIDVNGEQVFSLSFAALFVHVCVHGYIDYFFRLRYLVDVYAAMQQAEFDLSEITKVAEEWGVRDKVFASMAAAEGFFSTNIEEPQDRMSTKGEHPYYSQVRDRYINAGGLPKRNHPNNAKWTLHDKRHYLISQIKFRSKKSGFFAPIIARCKYNHEMVAQWPVGVTALSWYPLALIKRFLK